MLFQYLVPNFTLFSITLGATVPRGISPPVVDRFQRDLVGFTDHLQDDHPVKRDVTDAIASKFEGTSVRRRGITTNNADFGIPLTCAPKTFIRGEMIER